MTSIEAHCPSCGHYFRTNADLLQEGRSLHCPDCLQTFELREDSPFDDIVRLLFQARVARVGRQVRLAALLHSWSA